MKSITTAFRDHLDQEVTALCTCWTITRLDGTTLRFTDADEDVIQGGQTYTSIGAYQRTAIESTSTLSVDNLEIVGASNDLALPEEELRAGLFDNAQVTIFMTPWLNSVRGRLKLRRGFFGEVQTLPNGTYQVELRGIMQRLAYNYTDIFSATCLYDLGQKECGIIIKGDDMDVGTTYEVGDGARIAQTSFQRGKAYDINWGDPDFEVMGAAGGIGESIFWYNEGINPVDSTNSQSYSLTYSAQSSGVGTMSQDVDLEDVTGLPVADLDGERCYLTARAFRRDQGSTGQLRVDFLNTDGDVLGYGQVLSLGASGFVPDPLAFAGDFTIELWIKPEAAATNDQIIFGGERFGQGGGTVGTRLSFNNGTLSFFADNDDAFTGTGGITVLQSSEAPTLGEWRHIAIVRDGSDMYLYENYQQTASASGFVTTVWLDRWADGAGAGGFVGKWDELRVWTTAKTAEELALSSLKPIDPLSTDLLRYYHFNDANGADQTGGDLTFSFGPGPNLQTGHSSPVSVPVLYATALGSASYESGFADVGTTWTEIGVVDHPIPSRARRMRVSFDASAANSFIDNLTGHIINTNEYGRVIGYQTNNVAWRCTTGGAANADQAAGGVGSGISVGGVSFFGENAYLRAARVLSVTDNRTFIIEVDEPRAVDAWFNEGAAIFETGANGGAAMEIKRWNATTREIELFLSMPNQIKPGDYLSVYPGCDKSRISCAAIFGNIINFFGTPDVPGQDELFRYPDAK